MSAVGLSVKYLVASRKAGKVYGDPVLKASLRKLLFKKAVQRSYMMKGATYGAGLFVVEGFVQNNIVHPLSGGYLYKHRTTNKILFKELHNFRTQPISHLKEQLRHPVREIRDDFRLAASVWTTSVASPGALPAVITRSVLHHTKIAPRGTKRSKVTNFIIGLVT